jgi:CheY-like chemotaxis protein
LPGDFVMIEVADTGTGMPQEVVNRIFEPFFTTKQEGQGTGLGLSMVFGFIQQSGGHITVESTQGVGTVFRLHLPRSEGSPVEETAAIVPSAVVGGRECILVVEDNDAVRMITADLLTHLGYHVIEASQPQEALVVLESDRHIDLMFSDVVMPGGIDGFGLAQRARVMRPGLRLLLASGFAEFGDKSAMGLGEVRVLGKPFRQSELAHALREVLDAETTAS